MMEITNSVPVYLEVGSKRTFAGGLDWPGWCRSGRDEALALTALFDYGTRYAKVLRSTRLGFHAPKNISEFVVSTRLEGYSTTDFGSPAIAPPTDSGPINEAELGRFLAILEACWRGFDEAVSATKGRELRKGPRGGGRDLEKIIQHVLEADGAYLGRLGWKFQLNEGRNSLQRINQIRQIIMEALEATASIDKPTTGSRGGVRWMPRYFIRRVAWHVLDHAWEIEDRIT
ncbi:MAG: hypothetical protein GTO18_18990 [Anaerolineales bacterium]|nr:hypothetical protein [Anaerolineales bacterium]